MDDAVKVIHKDDGTKEIRHDGYVNLLNKYGTPQDNSIAYTWNGTEMVPDLVLAHMYETNGLFAKIIDDAAEEAFKPGFDLNLKDVDTDTYLTERLEDLNWEENGIDAVRWARLFGGSLIVMLINDGGTLDQPLNMDKIESIEELRVYDRSVVEPDYSSLYQYDLKDPWKVNTTKFGMPEYYFVYSIYGQFVVHESRCLVFKNGNLPEKITQALYRFWGIPEYVRIQESLKDTLVAHSNAGKLLERCVQAIYKMKNLSMELQTEDGEERVLKRLQIIDMARGILNSIVIDAEGEDYVFEDMTLTNVDKLVDKIAQMLCAITNYPQAKLFGREPAGMNATGDSDFENWYNYLDSKIRKRMIRKNLKYLIDIICKAGIKQGKIKDDPNFTLEFKSFWNLTEEEESKVNLTNAQADKLKAETAEIYIGNQVLDPPEIRKGLKKDEEMEIDELLDEESPDEAQGFIPPVVKMQEESKKEMFEQKSKRQPFDNKKPIPKGKEKPKPNRKDEDDYGYGQEPGFKLWEYLKPEQRKEIEEIRIRWSK
jgi:phage-related protein (TIGR01555 family)